MANKPKKLKKTLSSSKSEIIVDLNKEHQTIMGFGGAFTDSFGQNLKDLTPDLQDKLLESYFGKNGLHYHFGRVPIGGTDFSARNYTYDDTKEPDYELKHWSLTKEDYEYKMPAIKKALNLAKQERNVDLKLFASPWSPPAWMKTSNSLVRGHLIDSDLVYSSYTEYLMKFYKAYKEEGINFWGATVQNEPVAAYLPIYFFNSMQFSNLEMTKFITKYLGPALEKNGYTKENFKLMVGDDPLGFLNNQVVEVMQNKQVQKYISGVAFHWYTSGNIVPYSKLTQLYDEIKDKIEFVMMSEACEGSMPLQKKVDLGSWSRAESYASDIIEDLLRQTNAWIDWNMALDLIGGPNWSGNFVDSPIIIDKNKNEFYKQPMYYSLAHFSRFFLPGSIRVETQSKDSLLSGKDLMTIAVLNKQTGHIIINIVNKSKSKKIVDLTIINKQEYAEGFKVKDFVVDKRSINTILVKF